jgi:fermentation-respiration switch protein FrsA (DUF1100 family)
MGVDLKKTLGGHGKMKISIAAAALILANGACYAQTPAASDGRQIQTKMMCTAYTGNPTKEPAFQIEVPFTLTDGVLTAERTGSSSKNRDVFTGLIASSGDTLLIGHGDTPDKSGHWVWEFRGKYNEKGSSVLKGGLHSTLGAIGGRTCTLSF